MINMPAGLNGPGRLRAEVAYLEKLASLDPVEQISCAGKARLIVGLRHHDKSLVLLQVAGFASSTSYFQCQGNLRT